MIFRSGFKIIQGFGLENTDPDYLAYYQSFGMLGHDGIDVVYKQWEKLPIVLFGTVENKSGIVVKINNTPFGAYGRFVEVWVPELNAAFMYCHLASICVTVGESVDPGDALGVMGGSANGEENGVAMHVHICKIPTDDNGYRDYSVIRNGYGGLTDPTEHFVDSAA